MHIRPRLWDKRGYALALATLATCCLFLALLMLARALMNDTLNSGHSSLQSGELALQARIAIDDDFGNQAQNPLLTTANNRDSRCDRLNCTGLNQGQITGEAIQPNTIHDLSYFVRNTGEVSYLNYLGDRLAVWGDASSSRYQPVEYVEFTEAGQYINTGINHTTADLFISADFAITLADLRDDGLLGIADGSTHYLFGVRSEWTESLILARQDNLAINIDNGSSTQDIRLGIGALTGSAQIYQLPNGTDSFRGTVAVERGPSYYTGTLVGQGGTTKTFNAGSTAYPVTLGALNYEGSIDLDHSFIGKVYAFSMSSGDTSLRNFYPAFDSQTNTCGFYDAVSGDFFAPVVGTLLCPAAASYAIKEVTSIHFDGQAYIDTGIAHTTPLLGVTADYQYSDLSRDFSSLFGARNTLTNPSAPGQNLTNGIGVAADNASEQMVFQYGADVKLISADLIPDLNRHSLTMRNSITLLGSGKVVTIDDESLTDIRIINPLDEGSPQNLYIGASNAGGAPVISQQFEGDLFGFTITGDDTLLGLGENNPLRDFIPARNTINGECGLFDNISRTFFTNAGPGTISCDEPAVDAPILAEANNSQMRLLVYPSTVSNATINAELAALRDGTASSSPSAIDGLDGDSCEGAFYGQDPGQPACVSVLLPETLQQLYLPGQSRTFYYKFVLFEPDNLSPLAKSSNIHIGLSTGARGQNAINWRDQARPYINAPILSGDAPTFRQASGSNAQPFVGQLAEAGISATDYLQSLVTVTDGEDPTCEFGAILGCSVSLTNDGGFNPNQVGTYQISYSASDSSGNQSTFSLTVQVWNFVEIQSGMYHGIARGSNGSVWTWGYNNHGQRGVGSEDSARNLPAVARVDQSDLGGLPVIDIAGSFHTSCALNSAGQAYCWGYDLLGSLGDGTGSSGDQTDPSPVIMPQGVTFTSISGSYSSGSYGKFSAIGSDGQIYVWGNGSNYRLGTGNTNDAHQPTLITDGLGETFAQVAQGPTGGAAVTANGQVYVWGMNNQGQMAQGNTTDTNAATSRPQLVMGLSDVAQVSYGGYSNNGFVMARKHDGTVWSWGWNSVYSLGLGNNTNQTQPVQVGGISNVRDISAGPDYSLFVVGNDLWGAGWANYGEVFAGNTTNQHVPIQSPLANVVGNVGAAVIGGYDDAWFLSLDGRLVWGIGYSNTLDLEFGNPTQAGISTDRVVPWVFTPDPL